MATLVNALMIGFGEVHNESIVSWLRKDLRFMCSRCVTLNLAKTPNEYL